MTTAWSVAQAQTQIGNHQQHIDTDPNGFHVTQFELAYPGVSGCNDYYYSATPSSWPFDTDGNGTPSDDSHSTSYHFTLPGTRDAGGDQSFRIYLSAVYPTSVAHPVASHEFQLFINGVQCTTCNIEVAGFSEGSWDPANQHWYPNSGPQILGGVNSYVQVTYPTDAWDQTGDTHFAIRTLINGIAVGDLRFHGYLVGANLSQTLGSFLSPQMPSYILRDPPGDQSYTQLQQGQSYTYGETYSASNSNGSSGFVKVKLGTSVDFFGASASFGVTAGVSASTEETSDAAHEYTTTLTTNATYTTAQTGAPASDLFIGSARTYNYGVYKIISRPTCGAAVREAHLIISPTSSTAGFAYTEEDIQNTVIPQAQALVNSLQSGTIPYKQAVNQLAVWQEMLALNNNIKTNALSGGNPSAFGFSGGGSQSTFDESVTSGNAQSMHMNVVLEEGLSADVSADVGGNGVEAGGEIKIRHEVGLGANQTNQTTTTHTISFGDDDPADHFNVNIYKDLAYGAPVFGSLDNTSHTSCPYEGGYQLDQPQLWVMSNGTSEMTLNDVPIGTSAIFPIYACNNSDHARTYSLSVNGQSNPNGAIISGYNGLTSASPILLTIPANSCLPVGNVYLNQPASTILDFDNVEIVLSSGCDEDLPVSTITISAHFDASVGITEESTPLLRMYPVPANDRLQLALDVTGTCTVEMLDLSGRVLKQGTVTGPLASMDVSALPNGEYVLRTRQGDRTHMARFSVMHAQ